MPLRNNRTYPYKIELRTYLKYCNGAETFYSYDPQRRRLQNLAVNAGGKTIMDSALRGSTGKGDGQDEGWRSWH